MTEHIDLKGRKVLFFSIFISIISIVLISSSDCNLLSIFFVFIALINFPKHIFFMNCRIPFSCWTLVWDVAVLWASIPFPNMNYEEVSQQPNIIYAHFIDTWKGILWKTVFKALAFKNVWIRVQLFFETLFFISRVCDNDTSKVSRQYCPQERRRYYLQREGDTIDWRLPLNMWKVRVFGQNVLSAAPQAGLVPLQF